MDREVGSKSKQKSLSVLQSELTEGNKVKQLQRSYLVHDTLCLQQCKEKWDGSLLMWDALQLHIWKWKIRQVIWGSELPILILRKSNTFKKTLKLVTYTHRQMSALGWKGWVSAFHNISRKMTTIKGGYICYSTIPLPVLIIKLRFLQIIWQQTSEYLRR